MSPDQGKEETKTEIVQGTLGLQVGDGFQCEQGEGKVWWVVISFFNNSVCAEYTSQWKCLGTKRNYHIGFYRGIKHFINSWDR